MKESGKDRRENALEENCRKKWLEKEDNQERSRIS